MNKQEKISKVMKEFKEGTLKTSAGKKVKSRKQAVAIAMSESEGYAEKADLISQINIDSIQEAEDILKAAGEEELFEKAKHQDGDMHPNGKWVWVSSANGGKGDWRTKGGRTHTKHSAGGNAGTGSTITTQQKPSTPKSTTTEPTDTIQTKPKKRPIGVGTNGPEKRTTTEVNIKDFSSEFEKWVDSKRLHKYNSNTLQRNKEVINAMYDIRSAADCLVNIADGYKNYSVSDAIRDFKRGVKVFQDHNLEFTTKEEKQKIDNFLNKMQKLAK